MHDCLNDTIGGYNSFLQTSNQNDHISLYLFDHEFTTLYKDEPICVAERLTSLNYIPRGQTALLDSIKMVLEMDEEVKTVVIITDGDENASKKTTYEDISTLIRAKKEFGWNFIFMGANQDAIATACKMSINEETSLTFGANQISSAFKSASAAIQRSQQEGQHLGFTQEERTVSY